jgi:hypothetical protein
MIVYNLSRRGGLTQQVDLVCSGKVHGCNGSSWDLAENGWGTRDDLDRLSRMRTVSPW